MTLKDNLFKIVEVDKCSEKITYTINLCSEHFIYKAHFPGEPITPGVCILQIAQELLSENINKELTLQTVKNAKFTSAMIPDKNTFFNVEFSKTKIIDDAISTQCIFSEQGRNLINAKLSFTCEVCQN